MDGRDALVAVGMNGEPLPVDHGFPARLVVPGLYGYTSATKWVTELELTTFDAYDAYWLQRGWAQIAPIKTMARIDTPRGLANVDPGTVPIGGVAWAIHRGIEAVEVRIDDGPWQEAELRLYSTLCAEDRATAYSLYNSLLRRIDSFASSLEGEQARARRRSSAAAD